MAAQLPRCPFPACPVRYRAGEDRACSDHRDNAVAAPLDTHKSLWTAIIATSTSRE